MRILALTCLFALSLGAQAQIITATITATNSAANDATITVNGDVRTWKTTPTLASEIATSGTLGGTATNLYLHAIVNRWSGPVGVGFASTNQVILYGQPGQALAVSASSGWSTIALTTNATSRATSVAVPFEAAGSPSVATNVASLVAYGLRLSTNALPVGGKLTENLIQTSGNQTATGLKTFTGGVVLSNAANKIDGGVATNLAAQRLTIGATNHALMFNNIWGLTMDGDGNPVILEFGGPGEPGGSASYSLVPGAVVITSLGDARYGVKGSANTWSAANTFANLTNSFIQVSTLTNSTFYGTVGLLVNGTFRGTTATNVILRGTVDINGEMAWQQSLHTALANGNNAGVTFGSRAYVKIKPGPTAAFAVCGIAGGRDGRIYLLDNATSYTMTLANESGVEALEKNRIVTGTGGDVAVAAGKRVSLIFDVDADRWKVWSTSP